VFYVGNIGFSFSGLLGNIGPNIGRVISRVLLPRTALGRAVQSLSLNAILNEIFDQLDPDIYSTVGFIQARQFAVAAATKFYRAYYSVTGDNNLSVVFFPEAEAHLDLLKWDP